MFGWLKSNNNSLIDEDVLFKRMEQIAKTGVGSEECLKRGFLPVPIHFYQPIPDINDLEERKVWDKVSNLTGIDFNDNVFLETLSSLQPWAGECKWSEEPTDNKDEFYINNTCFSYGCASILYTMIRKHRPRRIIEIGSGHSSKIIRQAVEKNRIDGKDCESYTIIDPYSEIEARSDKENILKERVECTDVNLFKELEQNDILFIDSSHVCRIGGDVNFEILEILPSLKKGVLVHFHDIDLPYEYSKVYATNPSFRMFWTESYLLQAFLSMNNNYKVILPMRYVQTRYKKEFNDVFLHGKNVDFWSSGSFWIQRIM